MAKSENQENELNREKYLERLRGLRPIDDDFMRCIFKDNIPLVQLVLRIVTKIPDLEIITLETQRDAKRLAGARSVCFDVYATDASGKKYDLEVQKADKGAGKRRARYNSSSLDVENLFSGQDVDELPETFVIFITENDVLGRGKALYFIERVDYEADGICELFGDAEHIIYVNGTYRDDTEIGKLMHDFSCSDPDEMNFELMKTAAKYYKEEPKGVDYMCNAFEETMKEGEKKGEMKKAIETAKNLLLEGDGIEKISRVTGLTVEEVKELDSKKSA